jgi:hypothetical protein
MSSMWHNRLNEALFVMGLFAREALFVAGLFAREALFVVGLFAILIAVLQQA